jgi:hypothetical protein
MVTPRSSYHILRSEGGRHVVTAARDELVVNERLDDFT